MRFVKLGLISIVFLFLVITAISLLLPSTVNVSRTIDINAPKESVYNYINDLSKWRKWFAGYDSTDSNLSPEKPISGATLKVNKTTISIVDSKPEMIVTSWSFGKKSLEGDFNFFSQKGSSLTTVQWHFTQHINWYPWEKFASIASDKVMGPGMEKSLDNLKKLLEK